MNITKGTGYITLSNMNIQHMLATGGADISLNPYGGITNYGNLSVNNVLFYQNMGVGEYEQVFKIKLMLHSL